VIICGKQNDQATRAQLNVLPDPFLLPSPTEDVAATFLVVEDSQQCIQRACKLLKSSAGGAAPHLVVLLEDSLEASEAVEDHITTFMDNGAHDAIMCLSKSTDLSSLISTSFARAVSRKRQNSIFVQKIQRARSQCDQLFWEHVHECLEGFPEMNAVREVNGKVVQNLKLSRKLGQGSFGTVYAFQDVNNINRSGAAKVISKADVSSWDRVFAIWAEYHILQKLRSHPNVVEALGFLHGKKNIYIFMEMAGTLNLGSLLQQKQEQGLQLAQVHSLFRCICNGLAHCHELKVAHCDLKPENIVVAVDGSAKLIDFGEAVYLDGDIKPLTGPVGTMPFQAPEILTLQDPWQPTMSDVWALGVVLMELLCGHDALTRIMGWSRKPLNLKPDRERADELMTFFADFGTDAAAESQALKAVTSLSRNSTLAMSELLIGTLQLVPEDRMVVEDVAKRIPLDAFVSASESALGNVDSLTRFT